MSLMERAVIVPKPDIGHQLRCRLVFRAANKKVDSPTTSVSFGEFFLRSGASQLMFQILD